MDSKQKLVLITAVVFLVVTAGLYAYVIFFSKSAPVPSPSSPTPAMPLPHNLSKDEERRIKNLAENFVSVYGSYRLGDFSGLESLKNKMTAELWWEKSGWINAQKQGFENQPKKYITHWAYPKSATILSQKDSEVSVEVAYVDRELKGAIIQGPMTVEWVDEEGKTGGAALTPVDKEKKAFLKIIKVGDTGEWRVDNIKTR